MKKIIFLLLTLALCLSLTACGEESSTTNSSNGDEESTVGLPNPMIEITEEEFTENTGLSPYYPLDATDLIFYKINGETGIVEFSYVYKDAEFTFRYAKNDELDISGFYYDWTTEETLENYTIHYNETEKLGYASWYFEGANYCLDATNVDLELLETTVSEYYNFYSVIIGSNDK